MRQVKFFVPGVPVPKGSAKAFYVKSIGRAVVVQDNREKQKPWASMISYATQQGCCNLGGFKACNVSLEFIMPRPKAHYGANGLKGPFIDLEHVFQPDLDKLIRCVLDALKQGGAYRDDSWVVCLVASKKYGEVPGVHVALWEKTKC